MSGYLVSPQLLSQIQQTVRHYLNLYGGGNSTQLPRQQQIDVSGKLAGNLAKATSFSTAQGTATVDVWQKDTSGNMVDTGRTILVVNRMEHIEGFTGDIVYCRWMDGEWRLVSLDCGG